MSFEEQIMFIIVYYPSNLLRKIGRYINNCLHLARKLTVFLELRSRKTVRFSEQIMSADKYPSIFSRQIETIVYISSNF